MFRKPIQIDSAIILHSRAEAVWPHLVDWEHLGKWMTEAKDFRILGDRREGVDTVAEATIGISPLTTRDQIRVTGWDPPRYLEMRHMGWVKGTGTMIISDHPRGVLLFWREELLGPLGILGAIGIRLWKPAMRRIFHHDLLLLKQIVEKHAPL